MSKRILLIGFVVVCCVAFLPLSANAATSGDYDYDVIGDGICEITKYNGTNTHIIIPDTLDGFKVTRIHYDAFAHGNLTSVEISDGIEYIGAWAFWDNNINSVIIPDSVTHIDRSAFNDNAIALVNGEPSDGIIYARNGDGTEDKTTIVSYGGASDIINFIPEDVTTIEPYAFCRCGLTSVSIPSSVTTIERGAFSINAINSVNGEPSDGIIYARNEDGTEDKTTIVSYGGVSKIVNFIPYGVTTIGPGSFFELDSIALPKSITFIDQYAFYCNFSEFQLPLSDRDWAEWYGSDGNIYSPGDTVPVEVEYKLIDYKYDTYEGGVTCEIIGYYGTETDIVIPDTLCGYKVINIRYDAFKHGNLTSVKISEGVESIGDWAFWDNNITRVTIPDSVNFIAKSAFNDNAIKKVNGEDSKGIIYARTEDGKEDKTTIISFGGDSDTIDFIPQNVTTIGPWAFSQCGLTSVSMPSGVTTIGGGAFKHNEFSEFILPGVNAVWHSHSGSTFHSGDKVSVDDEYKVVSIAQPTPTVAPEEPDAQTGVVTGKLEDESGNPLPNYQVTLYSDPIKTVTDSNGVYTFNNVSYTSHTLVVADESGVEKGRVFLNFKKDSKVGATVSGNTVETAYTNGTIEVELLITVDEAGVSIESDDIKITENPETGEDSMSMLYLLLALGTVIVVCGFFLVKQKLVFK